MHPDSSYVTDNSLCVCPQSVLTQQCREIVIGGMYLQMWTPHVPVLVVLDNHQDCPAGL